MTAQLTEVVTWAQAEEEQTRFLVLTLTTPSVQENRLQEAIQHMTLGVERLMNRSEVVKVVKGTLSKLCLTYNGEPTISRQMWQETFKPLGLWVGSPNPYYQTYGLTLRALLAVSPVYFTGGKNYLTNARWLTLWRAVMPDSSLVVEVVARKIVSSSMLEQELEAFVQCAALTARDANGSADGLDGMVLGAFAHKQELTYRGVFATCLTALCKQEDS